jgi:hypothetical protein
MKTIAAVLSAIVVLAVAPAAGAMPIDNYRSVTSAPPTAAPAPQPSSGTDTWIVFAASALAFAAGAGAARLVPSLRVRASAP